MPPLADLSVRPPEVTPEEHAAQFIKYLLTSAELVAAGREYGFAELECYVHSERHPDPFSHRHPLQKQRGRWYLHRTGSGYRAGSFKGLDFTLGEEDIHVGVLLRTLVNDAGKRIEGPSKIVDHLMSELKVHSLAECDRLLGTRPFWDVRGPLHICEHEGCEAMPIYRAPRVGLSLKRLATSPEMPKFLGKPYRFLTDPRHTRKDRPGLVLGLYREGHKTTEIASLTRLSPRVIEAYVGWFEEGRTSLMESFSGRSLSVSDRCRLLGLVSYSNRFQ